MRRLLLSLCVLCLSLWITPMVIGKDIPTKGEWHDEYYRIIISSPPTLSIEDNQLAIQFQDELSNLKICIIEERNTIVYENYDILIVNMFDFFYSGTEKLIE